MEKGWEIINLKGLDEKQRMDKIYEAIKHSILSKVDVKKQKLVKRKMTEKLLKQRC